MSLSRSDFAKLLQRPNIQRREVASQTRNMRDIALLQARTPRMPAPPEELSVAPEVPHEARCPQGQGQNHGVPMSSEFRPGIRPYHAFDALGPLAPRRWISGFA
eukprot:3299859-Alexandrium_andersonii.AAC.1